MIKYILPILLLATPALAQTASSVPTLSEDQWKAAAQAYRNQLVQAQSEQDDSTAEIALLQQQVQVLTQRNQTLESQLAKEQELSSPNKRLP